MKWMNAGSMNNLKSVHTFYCEDKPRIKKDLRDTFVKGTMADIRDDFQVIYWIIWIMRSRNPLYIVLWWWCMSVRMSLSPTLCLGDMGSFQQGRQSSLSQVTLASKYKNRKRRGLV